MYQFFSRPDIHISRTGDLSCAVTEHCVPGAPGFMRGLRLLFLSDVHAAPQTSRENFEALERRIEAIRPDLLLLGGDYADRREPCLRLLRALKGIGGTLGSFAVLGNNDREAFREVGQLRRAMSEAGIVLLVNESRSLRVKGGELILAGLDEYRHGDPRPEGLYPPAGPNRYRILLSHYPRTVDPMPDLMLSGHTHGGQFNALGVTPYTIGFERLLARGRASNVIAGLHRRRGGWMLVSKGIGASRIHLRVGVKPEINLVTFG